LARRKSWKPAPSQPAWIVAGSHTRRRQFEYVGSSPITSTPTRTSATIPRPFRGTLEVGREGIGSGASGKAALDCELWIAPVAHLRLDAAPRR
jgi:hypothetical protein